MCQVFEPALQLQLQSLWGVSGLIDNWLGYELHQALELPSLLYSGQKNELLYINSNLINTDPARELKLLPLL